MALKIVTLEDDDSWTVSGVVLDGVYRGERDVGRLVEEYGTGDEKRVSRALNNHYINARIVDRSAVQSVWDDDWETEFWDIQYHNPNTS